jgi:hypothetical protein
VGHLKPVLVRLMFEVAAESIADGTGEKEKSRISVIQVDYQFGKTVQSA